MCAIHKFNQKIRSFKLWLIQKAKKNYDCYSLKTIFQINNYPPYNINELLINFWKYLTSRHRRQKIILKQIFEETHTCNERCVEDWFSCARHRPDIFLKNCPPNCPDCPPNASVSGSFIYRY